MKKPDKSWINDWRLGENPDREKELGRYFVSIFNDFWIKSKLEDKSKSTKNRYSGALHCLGGYLTKKGIYEDMDLSAPELIEKYITEFEGPLIHYDNESWQNELDMVCRKLYKSMRT